MTAGDAKILDKRIKRLPRQDKRAWKQKQVCKHMSVKDRWVGMKILRATFKPNLYAKRDRHGKYTSLEQRAQATAEYSAEEQWTNRNAPCFMDVSDTVKQNLKDRGERGKTKDQG